MTTSHNNGEMGTERFPVNVQMDFRRFVTADELMKDLGAIGQRCQVTVRFLTPEGVAFAGRMLSRPEHQPHETVSREAYLTYLEEKGVPRPVAGKSWKWLVRHAYAEQFGGESLGWDEKSSEEARSRAFPVRFDGLVFNNLDDSFSEARLVTETLASYVQHIQQRIEEAGSEDVITHIAGMDAGPVMFETWRTFVNGQIPSTTE